MTSETGKPTVAIHILSNTSRSKGNQTMKLGQLIDITCEISFLKRHAENVAGRLVPGLYFFLKKKLYIK